MIKKFLTISLLCALVACGTTPENNNNNNSGGDDPQEPIVSDVEAYVTTSNKSLLFEQTQVDFDSSSSMSPRKIKLDAGTQYQEIEGFGSAITGSAAYNLLKMSDENRAKFLKEMFDPKDGLGSSSIRISIGCSDFSLEEFTCEDTKGDWKLHTTDVRDVIPVVKEILAINPDIKILGSPWTAPKWMKVSDLNSKNPHDSWKGGQLNPDYYDEYAIYFVKWINAMKENGIAIDAVTIQNEPLNRGNSASMYMGWEEQRDFIKNNLGPAFQEAGITAKIITFDHNFNYDNIADQQGYPTKIYADAEASKYIDGAAYHAYGGNVSEMGKIHNINPEKNLYFTEMSIGTWGSGFAGDLLWNMKEVFIGSLNNYSKNVIVWNLMLDDKRGPNRPDGGCQTCYGVVDINSADYKTIDRQSHYYNIAHTSKVIKAGAHRIAATGFTDSSLSYTAAQNPDGSYAFVAVNNGATAIESVTITAENTSFTVTIPASSVVSYRFKPVSE